MDGLSSGLDKTTLGQDLLGHQTEFDIDLCMTLTINAKLLNLPQIVITVSSGQI